MNGKIFGLREKKRRTSLAVQWLRFHLPMQGERGFSVLLGAKIPHALSPKKIKKKKKKTQTNSITHKQYCSTVNKDF